MNTTSTDSEHLSCSIKLTSGERFLVLFTGFEANAKVCKFSAQFLPASETIEYFVTEVNTMEPEISIHL